ncbi:MAG: hypothetical protein NT046_00450 [Arenimonas sp.]|nr:hypothetical protein [Arenimonas sp.]
MLTFRVSQTARGIRVVQLISQPPRLRPLVRAALRQAAGEYCTGTLSTASILDRFGSKGLARYGLRHRSAGYARRQTRDLNLRGPAAFISPRNIPAARITSALQGLASAKGGAATLLAASRLLASSASRPHLRDLITQPGIGHRILVGGSGARSKITITYPAANMLNRNPQYGEELRDLSLANYRDWLAITARANQIFAQLVAEIRAGRAAA